MVYVLGFDEAGSGEVDLVGGKGANLAALSRIDGIRVPDGFCVTTTAFARVIAGAADVSDGLARLARAAADDGARIVDAGANLRSAILRCPVPDDVDSAITEAVRTRGDEGPWAVRSSATAEDLPSASFAGQHDSYLDVGGGRTGADGAGEVLAHVRRCWASLFTDRAVAYRLRNGIEHDGVRMAVVVQRMVFPRASGVLFTADPVSSDRTLISIDAVPGLGDALVSGRATPDTVTVRDGAVVTRTPAPHRSSAKVVLTDEQAVALSAVGRRVEAHFGHPQDIEWCGDAAGFHIVQSRPITTLFPIPEPAHDDGPGDKRVYASVGHQQGMTDAFAPLGISLWQMTSPAPMRHAGGRLFVDVTGMLADPARRDGVIASLGASDPRTGDALREIVGRDGFLPRPASAPDSPPDATSGPETGSDTAADGTGTAVVAELVSDTDASLAALRRDIRGTAGTELLDFIAGDIPELQRMLFSPRTAQVVGAAMDSLTLSDNLREWLGDDTAGEILSQSGPQNITVAMAHALLDVADAVRPHPAVVKLLGAADDHDGSDLLAQLDSVAGGAEARDALAGFLERFGMRCAGEIDITTPRWVEDPAVLAPMILANVRRFAPGEAARRSAQMLREVTEKQDEVLDRLRALPDGEDKAERTRRMISRVRTFSRYREYLKYAMVRRYFIYKRALLEEADRLVREDVLEAAEDIFFLHYGELRALVRTRAPMTELIARRRAESRSFQRLTTPRVLTSDGEIVTGAATRAGVPDGALTGVPVSAGIIEGRARVVLSIADADLSAGDILVTAYTDPSWTPVFVGIAGLVTEVGGVMTHGAVIAREYGLPAVVGVDGATRRIHDGDRIRVHGAGGYVEILGAG
ncbi:rifamycin-inactivating phosphotransferase [Tomitella gaofuii]|uniref:rifamycin-inactivating phosphotransferase n=1 Tax=Tomitella gaofuii TaxID=2760083 RepID=UPI0015F8FAE3|nr:rifamycin-inactivating phosphotransferase [Tomitella gaofuii]